MAQPKKTKIEKANLIVKKKTLLTFEDQPISKVKTAFYQLANQLTKLESKENDRFKMILDSINDNRAEIEFALGRILAWNYFSEIQKLKEKHKSEIFILSKQIQGLKEKLIEMNSQQCKKREDLSITIDKRSSVSGTPVSNKRHSTFKASLKKGKWA